MKRYRALNLHQYIWLQCSDSFDTVKRFWKIMASTILIILVFYLAIDGLVIGIKSVSYLILFFSFSAILLCLFPPLMTYSVYKKSAKQYAQIESKVIYSSIGVMVKNRQSKSIHGFMGEWGASIQNNVNFKFTHSDVFETEHSIFLFPYSEIKILNLLSDFTYYQPIRFCKNPEEKIHNIYDIYKVTDFERKEKKDNTIISFRDVNFKKDVTLILKNYPSQTTKYSAKSQLS